MNRTTATRLDGVGIKARGGFSLMEALIVLILLAIVGSMAMPGIGRAITNTRADRAAQVIANDVEAAFSFASRERKPVQLVVDSVLMRIAIVERTSSDTLQQRSFSLTESEFGLTRLAPNPAIITVFPNGLASSSFVIAAWANDATRTIVVTRTGQIRVTSP